MAARTGNFERAETLLSIARQRAPRSAAARYLMADLYLRTNRPVAAMAEMAVLNRLLPAGSLQLAPSLAAYARVPGSIPRIKALLESYPELEEPLLHSPNCVPRETAPWIAARCRAEPPEGNAGRHHATRITQTASNVAWSANVTNVDGQTIVYDGVTVADTVSVADGVSSGAVMAR